MIANIDRGANLFGVLSYNYLKLEKQKGQILCTNNMIEMPDGNYSVLQLARSFEPYLIANNKTEKPVLHISLNPNPKDQVSDDKFRALAEDYMREMGYGNQPYVVFKHTDIDRTHIHIVSVCVDEQGRKISDSFEKRRSVNLSRELELKYELLPTEQNVQMQNHKIFSPVDYEKADIKSQIASVVRYLPNYYKFQSIGEYNALLSLFNISVEVVRGDFHGIEKSGLVYFALNKEGDKSSNPLKASLFGKNAGYVSLEKHFEKCKKDLTKASSKSVLAGIINRAMQMAKDETGFKKQLQEQGINTIVRRNQQGRIYGITFIDHNSKTVWNGSRFGKEFSANVFNDWWNNAKKSGIKNIGKKAGQEHHGSKNILATEEPHHVFNFLFKTENSNAQDEAGFLESIGILFPETLGTDYEEQNFENYMKKKKRRFR